MELVSRPLPASTSTLCSEREIEERSDSLLLALPLFRIHVRLQIATEKRVDRRALLGGSFLSFLQQAFLYCNCQVDHTQLSVLRSDFFLPPRLQVAGCRVFYHPETPSSTRTTPAPPSMVTLCPVFKVSTSPAIPTMVGMPISLATMAEWERMLPRSMRRPETEG